MSIISEKDVRHVAKLARLALSDEDVVKYQGQLEKILGHISELKNKDTENVPAMSHPFEMGNVMRDDVAKPFENLAGLYKNAPEMEETFYKVKKVIE